MKVLEMDLGTTNSAVALVVNAHGVPEIIPKSGGRRTTLPHRAEDVSYTVADDATRWAMQVTQGEERDLRYVKVIGEAEITYDTPKPAHYPILTRYEYNVDGLIHAYVFDGRTGASLGELHINRESNLSPEERAAQQRHVDGLSLG
jgi:molecular chaperone DnaK